MNVYIHIIYTTILYNKLGITTHTSFTYPQTRATKINTHQWSHLFVAKWGVNVVDRGSGPVWPRSMDRRTRNMDRRTGPQKLLSCFMCKTDSAVHGTRPVVHSAVRPAVHPMVHYQWICTYSDPHLHPTTSLCYGNDITPLYHVLLMCLEPSCHIHV